MADTASHAATVGNTLTTMADLCKTDLQKVISYLDEAAKIYEALPMQKCKCRAYMITQLTNKLKIKLNHDKK